jgi:hypothetical protein
MAQDNPTEPEEKAAESDPSTAEVKDEAVENEANASTAGGGPARRRDPKFRVSLIQRLPQMAYTNWSAKDNFKLDDEWGGVIALQSDAILGPLEPIAKTRRG